VLERRNHAIGAGGEHSARGPGPRDSARMDTEADRGRVTHRPPLCAARSPVERKNGWQLAEVSGAATVIPENPNLLQSLTFSSYDLTLDQCLLLLPMLSGRPPMLPPVITALLAFVTAFFRSQASLRLENLALRHQIAVYKQTVHRPRLCPSDRVFWLWLSRLWSGWQSVLAFVQPRTVLAWQRKRFRDHWRRLSQQGTPGRPAMVSSQVFL
jgi:hypothetical protein